MIFESDSQKLIYESVQNSSKVIKYIKIVVSKDCCACKNHNTSISYT